MLNTPKLSCAKSVALARVSIHWRRTASSLFQSLDPMAYEAGG